ncbi:MAG: TIGR01777 family oxidoreductase [Phycisphaerales bacterium]|nr:TIGR01777 family oxidoreductase [Phycisphaerales bacterium]
MQMVAEQGGPREVSRAFATQGSEFMRVFITGATGLLGRRLVLDRLERGDQVIALSRSAGRATELFAARVNRNVTVVEGDPGVPGPWQRAIDGCDVVVHLAGAGLADRRWTPAYKKIIEQSRVDGTYQVADAVREAKHPPGVVISASATGWYGDTGEMVVDETAPASHDFLGHLCQRWEAQANRMSSPVTRVVNLRTGIVLDAKGGALGQLVPLFKAFIGGPLGSGRQFMSWIHWRDIIGLINHAIETRDLRGPINAVAPTPVRNRAFSKALGRALGRPSFLPAPKLGVRIIVGEFAGFLFASQRVVPKRALESGYTFQFTSLDEALESVLHRATAAPSFAHAGPTPRTVNDAVTTSATAAPRRQGPSEAAEEPRPSQPIRLVAIDVDGTLLSSEGTISRGVIQACRNARRAGVLIVPATSRPPRGMSGIMQLLDLPVPVITYNGALIWDAATKSVLHEESMTGALTQEIIAAVRSTTSDVFIAVEQGDDWFTDRAPRQEDGHGLWLTEPTGVRPFYEVLERPVTKLNIVGSPASILTVRSMVSERFWKTRQISLFCSDPRFLQILSPMVHKGIALQRIANRRGISRSAVMAIGDASNDLGMIEWAGFGVAVANAVAPVKELADVVVPSNDDGGVARALQRYVLT